MGNKLQHDIMCFIDGWVREKKTSVPRKEIISQMESEGIKNFTIINSLKSLQKKGFIRKSSIRSNTTSFVQLRPPSNY